MSDEIDGVIVIGWGSDGELAIAVKPGTGMPTAVLMMEEMHKRCQAALRFKKKSLIETAVTVPPDLIGRSG